MPMDFPASPTVGQVYSGYVWSGVAWESANPQTISLTGQVIVANAGARDALYPSPVQGNAVFRNDLGYEQVYYGLYNVSTNPGGLSVAGWYRGFGRGQRALLGSGIKNNSTGAHTLATSYADLPDLPSTVVTSGLPVLITATITIRNGISGGSRTASFRLIDGSTQLTELVSVPVSYISTTDHSTITFHHRYTPTAGTRTIKVSAVASIGSAVQFMSGELKVEEIYE